MKSNWKTERLDLKALTTDEADFIFELVNTNEWKAYIGERNVKTQEDSINYIRKIIDNPNVTYWIVKLAEQATSVGIITLIKREYLVHRDIGFAFLPSYSKMGYAFEASKLVLEEVKNESLDTKINAITVAENISSIRLLEKLSFEFEKILAMENEVLHLYATKA